MKTVFILGGDGDIGTAIAKKFSGAGYALISPSINELDLEKDTSIENYFSGKSHAIDVLINCAGYNKPKNIDDINYDDIEKTLKINTLGFIKVIQNILPYMKKKINGHILAISSLYGTISRGKRAPYAMSKHALNGLVKTLAIELGQYNILINSLSPGFIDTKMTRQNNNEEAINAFRKNIPLDRLGTPEDIASIAYFLCSSENRYITGQNIIADGGYIVGGFEKW